MEKPIHVAIVDDEESALDLFKVALRKEVRDHVIDVHYFESAPGLLKFLQDLHGSIKIIIILSDINMPGMDGFQLLQYIKTKYPQIIVFMESAYDLPDYIAKAKEMGAEEYFTKPINFKSLREKISQIANA